MAGRRPLTEKEERALLRVVRKLHPRDRALITTQWFTGFRISEVLSLTIARVYREGGAVFPQIGIPPRHLKSQFGATRWVPVAPELKRALEAHWRWLSQQFEITPSLPAFPSRKTGADCQRRPLSRSGAHDVVKRAFAMAGIVDDGRTGTHTLRKTFAKNVYRNSGNDIALLNRAMQHSELNTTLKYLEVRNEDVNSAILACDFTRGAKTKAELLVGWPKQKPLRKAG